MEIRRAALACAVLLLAGCAAQGFYPSPPIPPANATQYPGGDGVVLTIETSDSKCCYIEGALRFARLEGPWQDEWRFSADTSRILVPPGEYQLTVYERGCSGSCEPYYVGPPMNHCSARFEVVEGTPVTARVDFPIPQPCTMRIGTD